MDKQIKKSESYTGFAIPTHREAGRIQPGLTGSLSLIQDLKKKELAMPNRLCVYDDMALDPSVKQPMEVTQCMSWLALQGAEWEPAKGSRESEEAAKFLQYNMHNMSGMNTWSSWCTDAVSYLKYGFATFNIVTEIRKYGQYAGSRVLKKLSPRSQHSLYGWIYNDSMTDLLGMVQRVKTGTTLRPVGFQGKIVSSKISNLASDTFVPIYNKNLLLLTHQGTNSNPQGVSPLASCYTPWMQKVIIEEYEVIGVSKDLGGLVVVRVPQELIEKSRDPETYPEDYAAFCSLNDQINDIHAGKQSSIILSSSQDALGYDYDIKLMGIDGAGKQYVTSEIIEQKRKDIYNAWGAGYLLLGQDSHGSYNLSSNNKQIHSFYSERNSKEVADVLNTKLAPALLAANRVYLDYDKMPKLRLKDPDQLSLDEAGKFIQRVASTGKLTEAQLERLCVLMDLPTEGIEDLDFTSKGDSRAGESNGTSGTGSSQEGGANSATNTENSMTTKKFVIDKSFETNNQIVAVDTDTGQHIFIDKEG